MKINVIGRRTMRREDIIMELRKKGCRITKQRKLLIDIILQEDTINCKEIYFQAQKENPNIGIATVYRMVQTLEEIGAIERESTHLTKTVEYTQVADCFLKLKGDKTVRLDEIQLKKLLQNGMETLGYTEAPPVEGLLVKCKNSVEGE